MGVLDKLMFWKKSDDFGKDMNLGLGPDNLGMGGQNLGMGNQNMGLGNQGFGNQNFGMPPAQEDFGFNTPQYQSPYQNRPQMAPPGFQASVPMMPTAPQQDFSMVGKDIELLSYKLDTIKAALDMVNQRLANIERIAQGEPQRRREW